MRWQRTGNQRHWPDFQRTADDQKKIAFRLIRRHCFVKGIWEAFSEKDNVGFHYAREYQVLKIIVRSNQVLNNYYSKTYKDLYTPGILQCLNIPCSQFLRFQNHLLTPIFLYLRGRPRTQVSSATKQYLLFYQHQLYDRISYKSQSQKIRDILSLSQLWPPFLTCLCSECSSLKVFGVFPIVL